MRYLLTIFAVGALAATGCIKPKFACSSDANCRVGLRCDMTQSTPVCAISQGACFPSCPSGNICLSGECKTATCTPDCPANQVCDQNTATCKDVTVASVEITSPAASSFAGLQLQTTATARAPGGVNGVDFQVRSASGTVLAHAAGVAAPAGSSNFAATVTLNNPGIVDGNASLVVVESYPTGTKESAPLPITIDLTAPTISLNSFDGRAFWLGPAKTTASVAMKVVDSGSGVDAAKVKLTLVGGSGRSYGAVAGASDVFTFTVPMADLGVAEGAFGTVAFKVDASDLVGNASATFTGHPEEALQVDLVKPTAPITADATWHSATESVTVAGTPSDAQSGLVGGAAKVVLTGGNTTTGTLSQTGTLTSSSFSVAANLASLTLPVSEGPFAVHVAVTDNAGNTQTTDGALNVDNAPPQINTIKITTPADYTNGANRAYYAASSGSLTVTATIADAGAGVKSSSATPCLYVTGDATCYSGALQSGGTAASGTYLFSLPRSAGANKAGDTPVTFTIQAEDTLASKTTAADKVHHQATSQLQNVYFDDVAPTILIAADSTWYARTVGSTGVTITVHATITDAGSQLKGSTVSMTHSGGTVPGVPGTGNDWTFALPATNLTQGTEGTISGFTITASDNIGNTTTTPSTDPNATRNVDDKAPAVTNLDVFSAAITDPGTAGVNYPATVSGATYKTGYDNNHYLYSDTLHVKGTITDAGAGLFASSLKYRLDGVDNAGKPVQGAVQTLAGTGCTTDFAKTCTFDIPSVALLGVPFGQSAGTITLVVLAEDAAVAGDGSPAHHVAAPSSTGIGVTRFWWSAQVAANVTVSGLAVHPNGDVVTTSNASSSNSVVALYSNGPFQTYSTKPAPPFPGQHWGYGLLAYGTSNLGAIGGAAAIGEGTGTTAPIYVAADQNRDMLALDPSGNLLWKCGKSALGNFKSTPAVKTSPNPGSAGTTIEYIAGAVNNIGSTNNGRLYVAQLGDPTNKTCTPSYVALGTNNVGIALSAVSILHDKAYVGSGTGIYQVDVTGANPATPALFSALGSALGGDFYGVVPSVVSGSDFLYAGSTLTSTHSVFQFTETLASGWTANLGTNHGAAGEAVVDPSGSLYITGTDNVLKRIALATGAVSNLTGAFPNTPHTPLLGSDGRIYLGHDNGDVFVINADGGVAWKDTTTVGFSIVASPSMDCSGHLYLAAADTVYAFITDANGLANTPWPKYQRDSRNSGNADAPTLWGVRSAAGCVQ